MKWIRRSTKLVVWVSVSDEKLVKSNSGFKELMRFGVFLYVKILLRGFIDRIHIFRCKPEQINVAEDVNNKKTLCNMALDPMQCMHGPASGHFGGAIEICNRWNRIIWIIIWIHPLGTMNFQRKSNVNQTGYCPDISLWTNILVPSKNIKDLSIFCSSEDWELLSSFEFRVNGNRDRTKLIQ